MNEDSFRVQITSKEREEEKAADSNSGFENVHHL